MLIPLLVSTLCESGHVRRRDSFFLHVKMYSLRSELESGSQVLGACSSELNHKEIVDLTDDSADYRSYSWLW